MEDQRFLPEGWDFTESEQDEVLTKTYEEKGGLFSGKKYLSL